MANNQETPWIIVHDGTGKHPYRMECERCGQTLDVSPPVSVDDYVKYSKTFVKAHKDCTEKKAADPLPRSLKDLDRIRGSRGCFFRSRAMVRYKVVNYRIVTNRKNCSKNCQALHEGIASDECDFTECLAFKQVLVENQWDEKHPCRELGHKRCEQCIKEFPSMNSRRGNS